MLFALVLYERAYGVDELRLVGWDETDEGAPARAVEHHQHADIALRRRRDVDARRIAAGDESVEMLEGRGVVVVEDDGDDVRTAEQLRHRLQHAVRQHLHDEALRPARRVAAMPTTRMPLIHQLKH